MKKFFLMLAALCCATAINATTYSCHVKVTVNGFTTEQDEVQVDIIKSDGAYDLSLKNFVLLSEGQSIPVGNVNLTGVQGIDEYGYTTLFFDDDIMITNGDDPQYDYWLGPMISPVPTDAVARFTDTAICGDLYIDLSSTMGQIINVSIFGIAPSEGGLEGDVNKDKEVNIADVNKVIDIILSK